MFGGGGGGGGGTSKTTCSTQTGSIFSVLTGSFCLEKGACDSQANHRTCKAHSTCLGKVTPCFVRWISVLRAHQAAGSVLKYTNVWYGEFCAAKLPGTTQSSPGRQSFINALHPTTFVPKGASGASTAILQRYPDANRANNQTTFEQTQAGVDTFKDRGRRV
jgi:hypothetical protein